MTETHLSRKWKTPGNDKATCNYMYITVSDRQSLSVYYVLFGLANST
jgi:hypothetical protein